MKSIWDAKRRCFIWMGIPSLEIAQSEDRHMSSYTNILISWPYVVSILKSGQWIKRIISPKIQKWLRDVWDILGYSWIFTQSKSPNALVSKCTGRTRAKQLIISGFSSKVDGKSMRNGVFEEENMGKSGKFLHRGLVRLENHRTKWGVFQLLVAAAAMNVTTKYKFRNALPLNE